MAMPSSGPESSLPNKSSSHLSRNRTRWFSCLRRSSPESVYAYLSLGFLLIIFLIVSAIDDSSVQTLFNRSSKTSQRSSDTTNTFLARFSAVGSAKQLDSLIQRIAIHSHRSNSFFPATPIVIVAVNYAYRKLALNFVCNLHRLNISNYIVLAMDRTAYEYLSQRDVHVFFHDLHHDKSLLASKPNLPSNLLRSHEKNKIFPHSSSRRLLARSVPVHEASLSSRYNDSVKPFPPSSFVETSRRKSLLVLRILSLGYSIIYSDVDVVWVANPIPVMQQQSEHFVFQSDTTVNCQNAAPNYNLNAGLFFARATPHTIVALRSIIKHAFASNSYEQKSFNYILCGAFKDHRAGPGNRIGTTQCFYPPAGTTIKVLPLETFPNGSDKKLWNRSTTFAKEHPDVVTAHANFMQDPEEKIGRIRDVGFWLQSDDAPFRNECLI